MANILDEAEADQIVKENLSKNKKVKSVMAKFLLDENGTVYRASVYESVTAEEMAQHEAGIKEEVAALDKLQALAKSMAAPVAPEQPAQPAVETNAQPTPPQDPNQTPAPQVPPLQ